MPSPAGIRGPWISRQGITWRIPYSSRGSLVSAEEEMAAPTHWSNDFQSHFEDLELKE